MKKLIVSILTLSGLAMAVHADYSLADEIILCVNQENSPYAVDARGLCVEGEQEYVISGSGIKQSEDLVPLAVFSQSENCGGESAGTTMWVGFDNDEDGVLDDDEVVASSGSCVPTDQ